MIALAAGPATGRVLILKGTRGAVGLLLASHDDWPGWLLVTRGLAMGNGSSGGGRNDDAVIVCR